MTCQCRATYVSVSVPIYYVRNKNYVILEPLSSIQMYRVFLLSTMVQEMTWTFWPAFGYAACFILSAKCFKCLSQYQD